MDVLPDVQFCPIGNREDADALALVFAGVVEPPQFGTLVLRVPVVCGAAEREDPLLGPGFLFVASTAAERGIETVFVQCLFQALRLPHVGVNLRPVVERIDSQRHRFRILVREQFHLHLGSHAGAESVHVPELPGRVDVQQWERRRRGIEGLEGQMQHARAVFADRVQHHRLVRFGHHFTHDVNGFRFEPL